MQRGRALALDSSGAAFIGGTFQNTIDFGGGAHTATGTDVFLAKRAF